MKGFAKAQDVRFGGRVDRELLDALMGQNARDQQDLAPTIDRSVS